MLEKIKNVKKNRKLLMALIAIIMVLGIYINVEAIDISENQKINPIYKPKWTKVSSHLEADEDINGNRALDAGEDIDGDGILDVEGLRIIFEGTASESQSLDGGKASIDYSSKVTSTLAESDITVYVDGIEADWIQKNLSYDSENIENVDKVTHELLLTGFEENARQANVPFKEWSGNVSIKIDGRGESTDTYEYDVLIETGYNGVNQSMGELDENGNWVNVIYKDTDTDHNTDGTMFADFIKPEWTYKYSDTTINHGVSAEDEYVTVVFDVVDKYYKESTFTADNFIVSVDNENVTANITKTLSLKTIDADTTVNGVTYKTNGDIYYTVDGVSQRIGQRYELKITNLDKGDGYTYSGPMKITLQTGKIEDKSGNINHAITTSLWVGKDTPGGSGSEEIVDVVDPIWTLHSVSLTDGILKLRANDKYYASSSLTQETITVLVNNAPSNNIIKSISGPVEITAGQVYEWTIELSNITVEDEQYVSFTPTNTVADSLVSGTNGFKYRAENGGYIQVQLSAGTITDQYTNTSNQQTLEVGNIDATKPEVYRVDTIQKDTEFDGDGDGVIDADANTETIIFNVTDRNFYTPTNPGEKNEVTLDEITLWIDNVQLDDLRDGATLTYKPIKAIIDNEAERVVGHQYTLVIPNIAETTKQEEKDYLEYSGTLKIQIAEDAVKDSNNNTLNTNSTTITDFVDYIKPEIEADGGHSADRVNKIYTINGVCVFDKYLDFENSEFTGNQMDIYVDGELAPSIAKPVTLEEQEANKDKIWIEVFNSTIIETQTNKTNEDGNVVEQEMVGVGNSWTIRLSNFEQAEKQTRKDFLEWSGTIKIVLDQDAVVDTEGNTLDSDPAKRTIEGAHIDFIQPRVEMISKTPNTTAKTETIVFEVYDKYLNLTDLIGTDTDGDGKIDNIGSDLIIKVDGEDVTSTIGKTLTYTPISNTINKTIDGTLYTNSSQVIGYQYTLVLSGFEQIERNSKEFKDYSGTVTIEIPTSAVKDTSNKKLYNIATDTAGNAIDTTKVSAVSNSNNVILVGDYVDFIKPDLKYTFSTSDINKTDDSYTMVFDITDKYYDTRDADGDGDGNTDGGQLTLDDLTIYMYNGKTYNSKKFVNLKQVLPANSISLDVVDKNATNVNYTETDGTITASKASIQIGHTYTLTITNLDRAFIDAGDTTANYSGVITVAIAADKVSDRTANSNTNKNSGTTLTSGVNLSNGTQSGTQQVVDTVKPIWTSTSTTAYAVGQTATIEFEGTDTYLKESTLTSENIKVYLNGVLDGDANENGIIDEGETPTVTKNLSTATYETETRYINSGWDSATGTATTTTEQIRYKAKHTLTLTGYEASINQVKIEIPAGTLVDNSDNTNEAIQIITYNVLKVAENGVGDVENTTYKEDTFLGGSTDIQRQNIQNITFKNSIIDAKTAGYITVATNGTITSINDATKCWDVSAQQDKSIIAWTTNTTAPYTVYIGSNWEIFANQDSSYLFKYIGYSSSCTSETALTDIDLLNVSSVTNMSHMFSYFGYYAMTNLDLGQKFNTINVDVMDGMFKATGYEKMKSLNLGNNFKTLGVDNMNSMFYACGYKKMESLNLGDEFYTNRVKDMSKMFFETGYTSMISLELGDKFYTNNVEDMSEMFASCGYTAMTALDLGDNFNTSRVTDMSYMFYETGHTSMISLELGDKFYTSSVELMPYMFASCGYTAMTALNLGEHFDTSSVTSMINMFQKCGYTAMTSLNLGEQFDTSNVTLMIGMFQECGYTAMETLDLGDNFDTSNVVFMDSMFRKCGHTAMTALDLGDKFYMSSVTEMEGMFEECGYTAMTSLDLGAKFTRMTNDSDVFTNTGKSGECTIYAPEAIYKNKTAFKLNSTDSSTSITYENGTINPIYRPKWEKVSSSINTTSKELTISLKGTASETQTLAGGKVKINYSSNVTSNLTTDDITVYVNGVEADFITKTFVELEPSDKTDVAEVTYDLKLSVFEESTRQTVTGGALNKFDEWSGNVSILIDGRGEGTGTYTAGTLIDHSGSYKNASDEVVKNVAYDASNNIISNQSMMELDETGTWIDVTYQDTQTDRNTNGTMFADFIKPEFTYISSETTVGDGNHGDTKIVTIKFHVADKYFDNDNSSLALTDLDLYVYDRVAGGSYVQIPDSVLHDSNNSLTPVALYDTVDTTKRIGTTYTLTIKNLEQTPNGGFDYSGPMALQIPAGKIKDLSTNSNDAKLITIGKDDYNNTTQGSDTTADIVDVVDPIWKVNGEVQKEITADGQITATAEILVLDRYYKQISLTEEEIEDNIQVIIDGTDVTSLSGVEVTKTFTKKESASDQTVGEYTYKANGDIYRTFDGVSKKVGERYELVLGNIRESDASFFAQRALYNDADTTNGGRPYREYSGTMSIVIPANTAEDNYGNKNQALTIPLNHVDTLEPEVIKVSGTRNINATNVELSTYTVEFDIVDKYIDYEDNPPAITTTDTSKIHVYLDGELTDVTKEITNIQELTNGSSRPVGYRYTLVLSNFEKARTSVNYDREYTDWSGDLSIKIDADTAKDTSNTGNEATILYGNEANTQVKGTEDYVDYIKPDVSYEFSSVEDTGMSDIIDKNGKTYKMIFDITDKNYDESILTTENLGILMTAEEETGTDADHYYDLQSKPSIGKNLTSVNIEKEIIVDKGGTPEKVTKVIGKRYTLTISNLEQLQKRDGAKYLDYSGAITITIPANKVLDKGPAGDGANRNGNDAISITSGINIPGGNVSDIQTIDVVKPIWERTGFTTDINAKTATITIQGTDKYFYDPTNPPLTGFVGDGTLTLEEIKYYVNGAEATGTVSEGTKTFVDAEGNTVATMTIEELEKLTENRIIETEYSDGDVDTGYTTEEEENGKKVQYGIVYKITINNFVIDKNQVKIGLAQGSLIDESGNQSDLTEILVYNALKAAKDTSGDWEKDKTSKFLGGPSAIQRQDIENITFTTNGITDAKTAGYITVDANGKITEINNSTKCWDVSAQQDKSIIAWTTNTSAPYTVYIGSNDVIYGNVNSDYLFSYIGYSESCTATETITGIGNLDVRNVTTMSYMFNYTGYRAMKSLNLGTNFDTKDVTNMERMFDQTGYTAMTSLDLGDKFDTTEVLYMDYMFSGTGFTEMTSLDLSSGTDNTAQFNTISAREMEHMFYQTGFTKMESLNLGNNFNINTEEGVVVYMDYMFLECGYEAMKSLDLGDNFNTIRVTSMREMFKGTGYTSMESLDLGTKFYTSNVTNMRDMFNGTGYTAMTSLDLSSGTDSTNEDQFNTSNVTDMAGMFKETGKTLMESLNLGHNFNTQSVTDMQGMFIECGRLSLTEFSLGNKFDTKNVTNMAWMFTAFGTKLKSLDLGDKFDTSKATTMLEMFRECGSDNMEIIDLGPLFTSIPSGIYGTINDIECTNYARLFENAGNSEEGCIIYAPEAIYKNKNAFKLSTADTRTEIDTDLAYTEGTINPIYRPKWEVVKEETTYNTTSKNLTIVLRGYAYETNTSVGVDEATTGININYASDVTSVITDENVKDNISIFIDGVDVTTKTNPGKSLTTTTSTNATTGKTEVIHTLTLNNFEEATRQRLADGTLNKFDEWSGNVTLKIKGRGEETDTYSANVLKESTDNYNAVNQNMSQTDETGTWVDIEFKDGVVNKNTDDTMFADFIKPEFTYQWSETVVDQDNKILTVVFYAGDKYLDKANSGLLLSDFYNPETDASSDGKPIFKVDGTAININVEGNSLTQEDEETDTGTVLRYTLVVKNLPRTTGNSGQANPYDNYSGPVTIAIPADKFVDYSGNKNDGKTITIGIDDYNNSTQNGSSTDQEIVDLVDPAIKLTQVAEMNVSYRNESNEINRTDDTIKIRIEATDKNLWRGLLDQDTNGDGIYDYPIKVKVVKPDGTIIENAADSSIDSDSRVNINVVRFSQSETSIIYDITLSKFGNERGELEGLTSIIIPEGVILDKDVNGVLDEDLNKNGILDNGEDTNGNGQLDTPNPNTNVETEIFIGTVTDKYVRISETPITNLKVTAENTSIADFIDPTWEYKTSSITRDRAGEVGTVTLDIFGYDSYLFRDYLDTSKIKVLINGEEVASRDASVTGTGITKSLSTATYYDGSDTITELTETKTYNSTNNQGVTETQSYEISKGNGVKYTLTLGNFGTNEGKVSIVIDENTIRDSSGNGNIPTEIYVGNTTWVESDVDVNEDNSEFDADNPSNPKYPAFRNSIVDFIKPVITYTYAEGTNPNIDRENEKVYITFDVTDTNFLSSNIRKDDIQIFVDDQDVTTLLIEPKDDDILTSTAIPAEEVINGITNVGIRYTLELSEMELSGLINSDIFKRHSGVIKLVIAANRVEDTSGNKNIETTIIVDRGEGAGTLNGELDDYEDLNGNGQLDTGEDEQGVIVDFIDPIIKLHSKYTNWEERYALITLRATDRFYDTTSELEDSDLTLYQKKEDGTLLNITKQFYDPNPDDPDKEPIDRITITTIPNDYGEDFVIRLDNFTQEFRMQIDVAAGTKTTDGEGNVTLDGIYDTSHNLNQKTTILVDLDNKKPYWKYVRTDTDITDFEDTTTTGTISFYVDGLDRYLNVGSSILEKSDIQILLNQQDITNTDNITVTKLSEDTNYSQDEDGDGNVIEDADGMRSVSYRIDVTGLTEVGVYTMVIAEETLIDDFSNKSAATTISCSRSVIASNTTNHEMITYHITPDGEQVHHSYVRELMSVNTTGTNSESATYRPSSIGEIFNNGENPLFAEPMYETQVSGYTVTEVYKPKSFAGWAEADENGNIIYYTDSGRTTVSDTVTSYKKVFGLYDEIPKTITNLKALWQDATVIYVSQSAGDDSDDGTVDNPVKTITRAYELLNPSGTAENNIIVIKDAVEWTSTTTITKPAMITSSWAGIDYGATASAELKISADMTTSADITFDEIKLYTTSNKLIANYKNVIIGRGVTTPTGKYTFETIVGGYNSVPETNEEIKVTHSLRVEVGRYKDIVAGSTLATSKNKFVTHKVVIGNMKDTALAVNDKLIIEGKFVVGENEDACYPNVTNTSEGYSQNYADVTLYSGTINATDTNNVAIYLKSLNGKADGKVLFNMYGGQVNGNIYAGARTTNTMSGDLMNTMNFYGGTIVGDVYGQGLNSIFIGGSKITLSGIVNITGNVYGGSHTKSGGFTGTGSTQIVLNSSSAIINGNIYGGSNGIAGNNNDMEGSTTITMTAGKVINIYGSGNNSGNIGSSHIATLGGVVSGNIIGGAYNEQLEQSAEIAVMGGTINGNIYGGNQNTTESQLTSDNKYQNATIVIGNITDIYTPTINGIIYGGGIFDYVETTTITLNECATTTSVYGGSDVNAITGTANITLNGMTVNEIYGGGKQVGTVGTANIYLRSGTATQVYGGGYKADVSVANIRLGVTETVDGEAETVGNATVGTIFGGPNSSGTVSTANITLKSGNITEVYGGGNSASVGTATVTLEGITINEIHGGSKDAGTTTTANINLNSGTVTTVFGGGLDSTVGTTNIKHEGTAQVTTIYGGNDTSTGDGGTVTTSNIKVSTTVANIYGGNYLKGTTQNTKITIHGTPTITGKLYGGGYKSAIGTTTTAGSTTINIAGGTIKGDINGGSEQSIVYGTTNINIGVEALADPSSVTYGPIVIEGTIFGAGDSSLAPNRNITVESLYDYDETKVTDKTLYNYDYTSVQGSTHIVLDNSEFSPITYSGSIFGSGNGATYTPTGSSDSSTIKIKDFGTATDSYELISIERTGKLYIGNSVIELLGKQDINNAYPKRSYTLNRITNGLVVHDNTTLYTRRAFNMVGGFTSLKTINGNTETKATYAIDANGVVTKNVDNRLYTFEGVNLIFAKVEEVPTGNSSNDLWGNVNGMAFFGMYAIDRANPNVADNKIHDIYDPDYTADDNASQEFKIGTFVEGKHKSSHNINVDGFYTNIKEADGTVKPEIIQITDYGTYYDWIINVEVLDYQIDLFASTYGYKSSVELTLGDIDSEFIVKDNQSFAPNTEFTLNTVNLNPLNPGINLINPLTVPSISNNANNTFGLTMQTSTSGWVDSSSVNLLATGTGFEGSYSGDETFKSDTSGTTGTLKFNLYNSVNITEQKDLGFVNLMLTGKTMSTEDGSVTNTFKLVIQINIQTIKDYLEYQYTPSFTGSVLTQQNYTSDSKVDLTYLLYKTNVESTVYATNDYRVLSTTMILPEGTKITMKDYAQEKVYYYQVTNSTTYQTEGTRYLYRLSDFLIMDSTTEKYVDSGTYYNSTGKYIFEKYDISIDFRDANITTKQELKETYLELRNSNGIVKYDNGDKEIKYSLYNTFDDNLSDGIDKALDAHAQKEFDIEYVNQTYSVIETINIPFTVEASIVEQKLPDGTTIKDTEYYDKISGIAIEVVDGNGDRVMHPKLQGFKVTNEHDATEEYSADSSGIVRIPIMESISTVSTDYILSMTQSDVEQGQCTVKIYFFTSDDGKHYGGEETLVKEIYVTFINKRLGLIAIDATYDSRIVNKTTGENLEGNTGVDMDLTIGDPTETTNIRVELYKRNTTFTNVEDETTYTGTAYTSVDIKDYLQGTWTATEGASSGDGNEYILVPTETYETKIGYENIEFQKALVNGISTGEYKVVFRSYHNDILVQSVSKTFIVSE